jgi:tRNA(Arg) A34 adenosine deaminase TadA
MKAVCKKKQSTFPTYFHLQMRWGIIFLLLYLAVSHKGFSQKATEDSIADSYFVTQNKSEYLKKLADLPCGICATDNISVILKKLEKYLVNYPAKTAYADDQYARASALQALKSVQEGGYGIGAILIDSSGKILEAAHNNQIQLHRSDLHGEMSLLTQFEDKEYARGYMNGYSYKPGLTVFSSAEPCPMCFIRLATVGVETIYCTTGPDDGMVSRIACLPAYWAILAKQHSFKKGHCAPVLQKICHLLFFSYLLDQRGLN